MGTPVVFVEVIRLRLDIMVIDYAALGVPNPRTWNRPPCHIYSFNTSAGSSYYEPMLEYIDRKGFMGADVASKAVHVKHEIAHHSKSTETIEDKRSSTMIRDQYINMLALMYQEGVGRMESIPDVA